MAVIKAIDKDRFIKAFLDYCEDIGGESIVRKKQVECDLDTFRVVVDKELKWIKVYEADENMNLRLKVWDKPERLEYFAEKIGEVNPVTGRLEKVDLKALILKGKKSRAIFRQRGALGAGIVKSYIAPEFRKEYKRRRMHALKYLSHAKNK